MYRCPVNPEILQRNYLRETTYKDTLHHKAVKSISCTENFCTGSFLLKNKPDFYEKSEKQKLDESTDLLEQYYESIKKKNSVELLNRVEEVMNFITKEGYYDLTLGELEFGARTAWRNASRCPGRIFWQKLEIIDARNVMTEEEMFDQILKLLAYVAADKGNIKSALLVFPQRKGLDKDFRIWNSQLISYAGYRKSEDDWIGDRAQIEFTQICEKLGWKGSGTDFDVLPLVIQANGNEPKFFEIPKEQVIEVPISHPVYDFESLNFKYFAVVSFANFMFDIGGCQFTAAPFTAYYSAPEISRALGDLNRYNKLELFAQKMGLDTGSSLSLWQDKTIIELNYAILYSFKKHQIAITDHHVLSEQFVKFFESEHKERGGCPADWVWVNPQYSTHLFDPFHIELINYKLLPSIEYQNQGWKYMKEIERLRGYNTKSNKQKFLTCIYLIRFMLSLMKRQMEKRVKCTILYASETGRSEEFAKKLTSVFNYSFNSRVICMSDYDINDLENERLLIIVTSTYGNGDAPTNGEQFKNDLIKLKKAINKNEKSPFVNLSYSVFALGSTTYPNFCEFGKLINSLLKDIGAKEVSKIGFGDDALDQKKAFHQWYLECFIASTKLFSIDYENLNFPIGNVECQKYRLTAAKQNKFDLFKSLEVWHKRKFVNCYVNSKTNLQPKSSDRRTLLVEFKAQNEQTVFNYKPGDYVCIIPQNPKYLVDNLLKCIKTSQVFDKPFIVECKRTLNGQWTPEDKYPLMSLRDCLTYFLDINSPLKQTTLQEFAYKAENTEHQKRLEELANNTDAYEEWKTKNYPNLVEFLDEFWSIKIDDLFLLSTLPKLQPRYFSISSAPFINNANNNSIEITACLIEYVTKMGNKKIGVCSQWLDNISVGGENVALFIKEAPGFHMPEDKSNSIIMIAAGSGIAPFRSFYLEKNKSKSYNGEMHIYYGCRNSKDDDLYKNELNNLLENGTLKSVRKAYSRQLGEKKKYVQDCVQEDGDKIVDLIVNKNAHVYICGNINMAKVVREVLNNLLSKQWTDCKILSEDDDDFISYLKNKKRLHEDVYSVI